MLSVQGPFPVNGFFPVRTISRVAFLRDVPSPHSFKPCSEPNFRQIRPFPRAFVREKFSEMLRASFLRFSRAAFFFCGFFFFVSQGRELHGRLRLRAWECARPSALPWLRCAQPGLVTSTRLLRPPATKIPPMHQREACPTAVGNVTIPLFFFTHSLEWPSAGFPFGVFSSSFHRSFFTAASRMASDFRVTLVEVPAFMTRPNALLEIFS